MKKPYAYIPRSGVHRKAPLLEEPTTSVRAQDPTVPPSRIKKIRSGEARGATPDKSSPTH